MIVIKEKDAVYFATQTKVTFYRFLRAMADYTCEENIKAWHVNDEYGTIVMVDTVSLRLIDLLRYSDVFDCEFTKEGMNEVFIKIKNLISGTNCRIVDGAIGATIFIARGNKVYMILGGGEVIEIIDDFECVSTIEETIVATYECCKNIPDVYERIKTLYDKSGALRKEQLYPIAVISTKDSKCSFLTNE